MTSFAIRALACPALAFAILAAANAVSAQQVTQPGFFDRILRPNADEQPVPAQLTSPDLIVRLERLENQIRQLTGTIEQLQYRNQQLEQQVQQLRGGAPAAQSARPGVPAQTVQPGAAPPAATVPPPPGRRSDVFDPNENPNAPGTPRPLGGAPAGGPAAAPAVPSRRSDVFDPNENPNAPGAPRPLGTIIAGPEPDRIPEPPVGVPGGRAAGAPLDLSTLAANAAGDPGREQPSAVSPPGGPLPPPPPRNPNSTGAIAAVAPPSDSPKDMYDLAYGYVLRKDYALAEDGFRNFLRKHPSDRLASDANYWLGESLFQRQRYQDAAESFLNVTTKYETTGKAPDALLRLGQSLAALGHKEAACAALGEIGRKYPRASASVKQGVEREQKRVHC
jgi:tol-pal system protein YbgF